MLRLVCSFASHTDTEKLDREVNKLEVGNGFWKWLGDLILSTPYIIYWYLLVNH